MKAVTKPEKEKIYTCEVKKLFLRDGEKRWEWRVSNVEDAIRAEATVFRCKDCFGAVKLHGKKVENGPAPHVEHKRREDSEYCSAGLYFHQNPGRVPRMSAMPVE